METLIILWILFLDFFGGCIFELARPVWSSLHCTANDQLNARVACNFQSELISIMFSIQSYHADSTLHNLLNYYANNEDYFAEEEEAEFDGFEQQEGTSSASLLDYRLLLFDDKHNLINSARVMPSSRPPQSSSLSKQRDQYGQWDHGDDHSSAFDLIHTIHNLTSGSAYKLWVKVLVRSGMAHNDMDNEYNNTSRDGAQPSHKNEPDYGGPHSTGQRRPHWPTTNVALSSPSSKTELKSTSSMASSFLMNHKIEPHYVGRYSLLWNQTLGAESGVDNDERNGQGHGESLSNDHDLWLAIDSSEPLDYASPIQMDYEQQQQRSTEPDALPPHHRHSTFEWRLFSSEQIMLMTLPDQDGKTLIPFQFRGNKIYYVPPSGTRPHDNHKNIQIGMCSLLFAKLVCSYSKCSFCGTESKSYKDSNRLQFSVLFHLTWFLSALLAAILLGFVCYKIKQKFVANRLENDKSDNVGENPDQYGEKLLDVKVIFPFVLNRNVWTCFSDP